MELQWPLILFTSLLSASAGLFCVQGVFATAGYGDKAQKPATIASLALLVVGGIAVFFHLTHPDRLFNGFGHITSGITQELIAIVVMAVLMVLFLVFARREGGIPKWLGILAIIAAVALVIVMGHSYMVASRPAWNSILQPLSLLGAAAAIGAGLFAMFDASSENGSSLRDLLAVVATAANLVLTVVYLGAMSGATGSLNKVGNYFDATHPTAGMVDPAAFSPFAGSNMGLAVGAIVLAAVALLLAFLAKKNKKWTAMGAGIAVCAFVGAILLRAVFYGAGGSVFLFY